MTMTKSDILEFRKLYGAEEAIAMLLLGGKDGYDGTDYDDFLASLEAEIHNLND